MQIRTLVVAAAFGCASLAAHADTFTISGSNSISFTLPASPTAVSPVTNEGFIVNNVTVNYNNTTVVESVLFFEDGLIIGQNPAITKDTTDPFYTFSATAQIANDFTTIPVNNFIGYESAPIYTPGGESAPTFIAGTFELQDNNGNGDVSLTITADTSTAVTPEPSTIALLGTGLVGLGGLVRRRLA